MTISPVAPSPHSTFQERQVRTLAAYKLNIYSPYFEQSLAYSASPLVAPPGGAMSPADVATLIHYAAQYHVTVVPEQEAFGHLHHVLKYEQYSSLAETPHGQVLSPVQPGSLALIKQWFTQIAQQFPSPWVHIGADETNELGKGQTKDLVAQRGLDQVYVDFLTPDPRRHPAHRQAHPLLGRPRLAQSRSRRFLTQGHDRRPLGLRRAARFRQVH